MRCCWHAVGVYFKETLLVVLDFLGFYIFYGGVSGAIPRSGLAHCLYVSVVLLSFV